ncbi:MAG: hypothetical protein SCK29_11455 [Bacillota bacterium]|nr:hypothetical protein [Bacillota bacterium]MDW7684722.1 hypothetical protein [Bacillota bacterium]
MRVLEAYVGEYASGKSENAINRALELLGGEIPVTLVDLDLVEPFYTLRPLKRELEAKGLHIIAWETQETMGLGEAGSVLKPEMRWVLKKEGHVILDVGYGVSGSRIFNLLEGIEESKLKVFAVINVARPMTASREDILHYLQGFGRIDGLVNNSHLGDETDLEIIREGVDTVSEVADILGIPVVATSVDERFRDHFADGTDHRGNPVRFLIRFMGRAFW